MEYQPASALANPKLASSEPATSSQSFSSTVTKLRDVPFVPFIATLLAVTGVVCVAPTAQILWNLWTLDPLKSIGGLVPLASLLLVLRAWRALRWRAEGSWWGFALILLTVLLVRLREGAVVELILTRSWTLSLPPPSLVAVAYAAGCVLLFGGWPLLRAARFPVCLMALVNPVPHIVVRHLDLPLQHASAHAARSFAQLAGITLTADQLRLMFAPGFGMFIAPGCNGLRGAVAMGLLALLAGHLYRLRFRSWSLLVLAAITLGYVFNFLRLFGLVLYYIAALHLAWLQDRAEMADYLIGAVLFFGATILLFRAVLRMKSRDARSSAHQNQIRSRGQSFRRLEPGFAFRSVLFAGLCLGSAVSNLLAPRTTAAELFPLSSGSGGFFPDAAGHFHLRRQWNETLNTGVVLYHWAEYAQGPAGPVIAVGVSPTLGAHDTLLCHAARGEDWLWHGDLQLLSVSGETTSFSASFFNDGVTQLLEATTLCSAGRCGQHTLGQNTFAGQHRGLVYSRISPRSLLDQSGSKVVPVLLRAETTDVSMPPDQARARLTAELRSFVLEINPVLLGRSPR